MGSNQALKLENDGPDPLVFTISSIYGPWNGRKEAFFRNCQENHIKAEIIKYQLMKILVICEAVFLKKRRA
jgi:hypothetical protein